MTSDDCGFPPSQNVMMRYGLRYARSIAATYMLLIVYHEVYFKFKACSHARHLNAHWTKLQLVSSNRFEPVYIRSVHTVNRSTGIQQHV